MPFPPPPPPPPATLSGPPPPPPPGLPAFGGGGGKKVNPAQARDNLLQSIRQGKSLKKTVTIDKSKPLVDNSPKTPVKCNGTVKNGEMSSIAARIPNGLAELFAGGGIPKLKPTGLATTGQSKSTQSINSSNSSPVSLLNQTTVNNSPSNTNTLPLQKKNNGIRKMPNDIKSRGPPPQPPSFIQKPTIPSSTSEPSIIPPGVGHNRTGSVPSLVSDNVMGKGPPPGGYGKPNVAPKPPSIRPAVPIKSQLVVSSTDLVTSADGRNHVTRAHSMRIPRTPPVAPNMQPPQFNNMTNNYKNQPPAFHQSQDSILRSTSITTPNPQWGSRTLRPIKHPSTRPPPPPIKAPLNPPVCAPPPPPPFRSVPPTPPPNVPPHKSHPNNNVTNGAPPTPPTRHSSMRNGPTSVKNMSLLEEMEMKFSGMFKPVIMFPPPPIFQRVDKIYNSRLVVSKHQAPKPPGY